MPVLSNVPVRQAMASPRLVISGGTPVETAQDQLARSGVTGASVVDSEGRFEGTISLARLEANKVGRNHRLESLMDVTAPTVSESADLDVAVDAITTSNEHWVPILDSERKVVGTVATSDVVRGYRLGLLASLQKVNSEGDAVGSDRVLIGNDSPLTGLSLKDARLPISIIVTTIERNRDLVVPTGNTKLQAGDELILIGRRSDIDAIRVTAGVDDHRNDSALRWIERDGERSSTGTISPIRVSKWRSFELWLGPAHTHVVTERSVAAELKLEPDHAITVP